MRILGPPMGFDPIGPSEQWCWAESHGTHNVPLFPAREISLPQLEKYRILDLLFVGNRGLLMLVCSKVRVSDGVFYFW